MLRLIVMFQAFNSKQALNGHIRVHGGGSKSNSPAREYRPPAARLPKPQGSPASSEDLNGEGFPCKLCGRLVDQKNLFQGRDKNHVTMYLHKVATLKSENHILPYKFHKNFKTNYLLQLFHLYLPLHILLACVENLRLRMMPLIIVNRIFIYFVTPEHFYSKFKPPKKIIYR